MHGHLSRLAGVCLLGYGYQDTSRRYLTGSIMLYLHRARLELLIGARYDTYRPGPFRLESYRARKVGGQAKCRHSVRDNSGGRAR